MKKHESDMTPKERRELERSYMKGMTAGQKAQHIWAYYKTHMLLVALSIAAVVFVIYAVYRYQVDTVLNVLVINSQNGNAERMADDFKAYIGDEDRMHEILIDNTLSFTGRSMADYYLEMKLSSYVRNQVVDVMILDEEYYESYCESGLLQPFFKVIPEEEIEELGLEVADVYGIRITGNEKLAEYGFEMDGECYLAVMQNAPWPDNAAQFVRFLCSEKH
jgi:hypothetical protein